MDGLSRSRQGPLAVQREFAGSRLEEQILIRTYELVVPTVRRSVGNDRLPSVEEATAECGAGYPSLAKGA